MFLIFFGQQLLLVLFGQFFLNVNYLREPLAILLLMAPLRCGWRRSDCWFRHWRRKRSR
jgi:hypothetical protein